ncbi:hypothetical protein IVA80_34610 [Bradyrhizobium sp. 139]|uniref:hypothetical protein n=1 Tax=Bradyrhizobium sp. 139 TaxID=2782616 RepID=UPI001FFA6A1E|nr:hypothetical protein [Bradyrhizobium sp. 139]MCK1745760.1 hypothetical protein [Bradyrhizobium sp. 139]
MTITLAWVRHHLTPPEIVIASDSRLRTRGPMDQAQKIYQLRRGDCCLSFCGDAQIAYPLFVQVSVALDNHFRTSSRALDVTSLTGRIEKMLNNMIDAWKLPTAEKAEELAGTTILFAGWSWRFEKPHIGIFKLQRDCRFQFHRAGVKLPHPWRAGAKADLFFIGDYKSEYFAKLSDILQQRYPAPPKKQNKKIILHWDYEPVEALQALLREPDVGGIRAIGGAPQVVKVYPFAQTIPIVVRTGKGTHSLLGRRLFVWEVTEYPILDLSTRRKAKILYPKRAVPVPDRVRGRRYNPRGSDAEESRSPEDELGSFDAADS